MLDDPARRGSVDSRGMLGILGSLPEQLEEGLRLGRPGEGRAPVGAQLVVVGMGGSAIAGDLAGAVAKRAGYPIEVVRDVRLPPGLQEEDLLAFLSYSGNTWETLACYHEALARGLPCVTLSSGGALQEISAANGTLHIAVPPGLPPRGALGYLLAPLLALLFTALPALPGELTKGIEALARRRGRWAPAIPTSENEAKILALALQERTPVIYAPPSLAGVARRWQTELNEMAKVLAWSSVLPEADHNELVGWMEDPGASRFAPVFLGMGEEGDLGLQIRETVRMIEERVEAHVVTPRGTTFLSQLLELVHLGDMVSVYLAIARGVDPYPVDSITRLKAAVQAHRGGKE